MKIFRIYFFYIVPQIFKLFYIIDIQIHQQFFYGKFIICLLIFIVSTFVKCMIWLGMKLNNPTMKLFEFVIWMHLTMTRSVFTFVIKVQSGELLGHWCVSLFLNFLEIDSFMKRDWFSWGLLISKVMISYCFEWIVFI